MPVSSAPLKNGIVVLDENGTILEVIDTKGNLRETEKLEFYNGIIAPGFVLPWYPVRDEWVENDQAIFTHFDRWLHHNGIAGLALVQSHATHFPEKQKSRLHYHTIIEICPEKDCEFEVFQSSLEIVTDAWNEYNQPCSISAGGKSLTNSDVPRYILEYISTHQSIMALEGNEQIPQNVQNSALRTNWERIQGDPDPATHSMPGHLFIVHHKTENLPVIEQNLIPGLTTFNIFQTIHLNTLGGLGTVLFSPVLDPGTGNTSFLKKLYTTQENLLDADLNDILPMCTLDAARAIFEDHNLGSIEPGKSPGLNLISNVDFSRGSGIKLQTNSELEVL